MSPDSGQEDTSEPLTFWVTGIGDEARHVRIETSFRKIHKFDRISLYHRKYELLGDVEHEGTVAVREIET